MTRRLLLPALMLAAVMVFTSVYFASATVAEARAPDMTVVNGSFSDVMHCGAFNDVFHGTFRSREKTFYDSMGDQVRFQDSVSQFETDTNSVTGKTITVRGHYTAVTDFASGTTSFNGAVLIATAPGQGIVVHDSGKAVFDANGNVIKEAGPHQSIDTNGQIFCTALGG